MRLFDSGETIIQVAIMCDIQFVAIMRRFCGETDVATERQTDQEENVGHAKVFSQSLFQRVFHISSPFPADPGLRFLLFFVLYFLETVTTAAVLQLHVGLYFVRDYTVQFSQE